MSVLIKNMDKPQKCMWMDEKHDVYYCPLLDNEDRCRLQDCKEEWTWDDQYAGCPIEILPSAQPEIVRCKECRYYKWYGYVNGNPKYLPRCGFSQIYVDADDFCSRAERREE